MRMHLTRWLVLTTLVTTPLLGLDVSQGYLFKVLSGSLNGHARVLDKQNNLVIEGEWRSGKTVPGQVYRVHHVIYPDHVYEQVYDQDGFLEKGIVICATTAMMTSEPPRLEGEFKTIKHPMIRRHPAMDDRITVATSGTYYNGVGLEYRGAFEFIPARDAVGDQLAMGYYVFSGEVVDTDDGTSESGLYFSSITAPGLAILFTKATPKYLAQVEENFRKNLAEAQRDYAQRDLIDQKWDRFFKALAFVADLTTSYALGGLDQNKLLVSLVSGTFTNSKSDSPKGLKGLIVDGLLDLGLKKLGGTNPLTEKFSKEVAQGLGQIFLPDNEPSARP